ncbi:hypothetical protein KLA_16065 [Cellulophaga geojensis KL-A]|uniref:Pyrrolo-quinoline quinone n=1 Tax=Cellulophaga geojensis KL-A TaxID=1328323 RepID=A0ABN0RK26_9FLAO|nr:PQQ-binding-like beta-propeller repeat protein [Cellulophaga geojensis]EWH11115.1 hypothetical protein KLA_16065 [Cellulophaga geojensis KL-A]
MSIIKNVKNFFIREKLIYQQNFNVKWDDIFIEDHSIIEASFDLIWLYDNKNDKTKIYNWKGSIQKEFNHYVGVKMHLKLNHETVLGISQNQYKKNWILYNLDKNIIVEEYPIIYGVNSILNKKTFLSTKENNLSCHQLENAEELWKLDVSKLGEYLDLKGTEHEELRVGTVHELYTYNAILVALLRNDTIIGIDSATGDVLWQKPLFLFISRPVQLNDKLYHIITGVDVKNMLQVYDLATGKLEREVEITHPVLKENTFFTKRFINDTYIALTATKTGEILVINHKTAIVEDYAKLPNLKEKIPIDNIPQVHQNKVYQLDGEGTLYILEKEE